MADGPGTAMIRGSQGYQKEEALPLRLALNSSSSGPLSSTSRNMFPLPSPSTASPQSVTHLAAGMAVVAPHGEREVTAAVHAHHGMSDRHQGGEPLTEADPQPLPDLRQPATTVRREPEGQLGKCSPFLPNSESSLLVCLPDCEGRQASGLNCGATL